MAQASRRRVTRGKSYKHILNVYAMPEIPTNEITALTNTKPAIASALAHGLKTGDAIWLESVSNEAINGYYLVDVSDEDTCAIIGLDGTDIGTVTDAKFTALRCYRFCDATSVKISKFKTKEVDVTTNCDESSVTETEKEAGSISLSGLWVPDKPVQNMLEEVAEEMDTIFITIQLKDSRYIFGFQVKITSFDQDGKSGDKWQFALELKINGSNRKLDTAKGVK